MTPRTVRDIHATLSTFEKWWTENPHLTMYGALQKLLPDGADSLSDDRLRREVEKRVL